MYKFSLFFVTSLIVLFNNNSLFAQEAEQETGPDLVPETVMAQPKGPVNIMFPGELRIKGNEGWVELNYIVDKEGKVKDPIVINSVGGKAFEKAAIEAINLQEYSPSTYKGTAVEEAIAGEILPFEIEQTFEGVDQGFLQKYNDVLSLLQAGDFATGGADLDKLALSQDITLQEVSMLEVLRASIAGNQGNLTKQLQHLRSASVGDGIFLSKPLLANVLQTRFVLAAKYSLFHEAFASYNLFEKVDPLNEKLTALALAFVPMQKAVESGQLIMVNNEIGERGYFSYTPTRRIFAFHSADAGVSEFEPRCQRKNQRFPVNTTNEWKIPASWGDCTIVIYGTPGAKFALTEYADEAN